MLLAIETGHDACSVALIDQHEVVASRHEVIGRGHAERLAPLIAELLGEGHERPDAIAVDVGPGSFTGIRVGIAAARALALVWRVPVSGFSSTSLVAAAAFAARPDLASMTVAMEAGRGEVFLESFDGELVSQSPPIAIRPQAIGLDTITAVAGTGVGKLAAAGCTASVVSDLTPDAADVRLLPPALRGLPPTPIYVRPPDAKLPG